MIGNVGLLQAGSGCKSGVVVRPGVQVFHDADARLPVFTGSADETLRFETCATDASYLSFVSELSADLTSRIRVGMFLVLDLDLSAEPAHPAYVRADFTNEGGGEELHDLIVLKDGHRIVRFNLDGLRIPLDRKTDVWVHVILPEPANIALSLRGFEVSFVEQ